MKRILIVAFMLPLIMNAQNVSITFPTTGNTYSKSDPIKPGEMSLTDSSFKRGATVEVYDTYIIVKCKVHYKACATCQMEHYNCYRKDDGKTKTYWLDKKCYKRQIYIADKNWYFQVFDIDWE